MKACYAVSTQHECVRDGRRTGFTGAGQVAASGAMSTSSTRSSGKLGAPCAFEKAMLPLARTIFVSIGRLPAPVIAIDTQARSWIVAPDAVRARFYSPRMASVPAYAAAAAGLCWRALLLRGTVALSAGQGLETC